MVEEAWACWGLGGAVGWAEGEWFAMVIARFKYGRVDV